MRYCLCLFVLSLLITSGLALLDWACAYYREFASRGPEGAQLTWSATRHSYDVGFSQALYWTTRGLED